MPMAHRFGTELPESGSRDEVALGIEGIVDGGMDGEEALIRPRRLATVASPARVV